MNRNLLQLGYPATEQDAPLRLERLIASRGIALLAVREGQVVGLAEAHLLSVINQPREAQNFYRSIGMDQTGFRFGKAL